mgnify:CR=1 FL=1
MDLSTLSKRQTEKALAKLEGKRDRLAITVHEKGVELMEVIGSITVHKERLAELANPSLPLDGKQPVDEPSASVSL